MWFRKISALCSDNLSDSSGKRVYFVYFDPSFFNMIKSVDGNPDTIKTIVTKPCTKHDAF